MTPIKVGVGQNRSLLTIAQSSSNRTQSQKLTVAECLNMNLNTVRVFVRDIVSAKRFYGEALGLRISADGSEHGYCVFEAGAATLVVEAVPSDATPADLDLVGRFTGLSFEVPSATIAYGDLRSRGVTFTGEPEKQFWGGTLATFKDPSDNELQICEQPQA